MNLYYIGIARLSNRFGFFFKEDRFANSPPRRKPFGLVSLEHTLLTFIHAAGPSILSSQCCSPHWLCSLLSNVPAVLFLPILSNASIYLTSSLCIHWLSEDSPICWGLCCCCLGCHLGLGFPQCSDSASSRSKCRITIVMRYRLKLCARYNRFYISPSNPSV